MQPFHRPALTAAFAAFAFAAPSHAQEKPYYVGPLHSLKQAEARLAETLDAWQTEEQNGGLIDASGLVHLDQLVFLPGSEPKGAGVEETPPPLMDAAQRAEIEPVQRRFRERAIEMANQPVPVRYEDVRELQLVIFDGQFDAAMEELARSAGTEEWPSVAYQTALESFAKRVRYEVDPKDERQAQDAENLIAEFHQSLEFDVKQMRKHQKDAGLEQSWLLAAEFRMHVERTRHRWIVGVGQSGGSPSSKPWKIHPYASLVVERQRRLRSAGIEK